MQLHDKVIATRDAMREKTGSKPLIGFVLGSGLGAFAESLDDPRIVPYDELEHIPKSTVPGHAGRFVAGHVGDIEVAVLSGRAHYYEGIELSELTIAVRALVALGCRAVVVTNAAGGIHAEYRPGDLMVIVDHLNLHWVNPLRGPHDERLGPRFIDMSLAYDRRLRRVLHQTARSRKMNLHDGVYACVCGPSYETPAEIRMLRAIGADAVGMSTVYEVIAARHAGTRVVGLTLISNLAAGIGDKALSPSEVTETAGKVADATVQLLRDYVPAVAQELNRG